HGPPVLALHSGRGRRDGDQEVSGPARAGRVGSEVQQHPLFGPPWTRDDWYYFVGALESKPLIQPGGGVVAVENPQPHGPHAGLSQYAKQLGEHALAHALTAESRRYPHVLDIALMGWRIWLSGHTD